MKALLLVSLFALFSTAHAQELIKSCDTVLKMPENKQQIKTLVEIFRSGSALAARTTQVIEGQTSKNDDIADFSEHSIREGLTGDMIESDEVETFNKGEGLIVHAMALTEDPDMEGTFSVGKIVLKKVRSVKVYGVGQPSNMGQVAIVETYDQKGKNLGSFLGGFLVSPCK